MTDQPQKINKKLLENPFVGSLVVPIAIVLVGALIIFGVTKLLSSEQSYKDLVREMQSKTFGNRWIAAYELSKVISSKQVPPEDIPWLVENLVSIYKSSSSPQTREFVITALGALRSPLALAIFSEALSDQESKVQFQALVGLSNLEKVSGDFDWQKVIDFVGKEDEGMAQAAFLTLSTHNVPGVEDKIAAYLTHQKPNLRFSSAISLINYKDERALPALSELLLRDYPQDSQNAPITKDQLVALKLNLLFALEKNKWNVLGDIVQKISNQDKSVKVTGKARSLLNMLKN